ncbi:SH3 domain-containing protein [Yinghuangia soli]|uniref:SH3 domain-containing protein n=1 Tax=Yinghuangia soli TaxID=2908204 RepID=A0AA41Q700_9ACTN|nr:SH3 domain-containing protein [Yinghuangia soli]MCF2531372.1 SH3 domain-containing protein [Yinghuangia soli]
MADEPSSLGSWLKTQVQRKPSGGGEEATGSGGGLRLSRGMWIALGLSVVVIVVVLLGGNDNGTPTENASDSGSPTVSSSATASGAGAPGGDGTGAASGDPNQPAATATGTRIPKGKTAFTQHRTSLIVRSEPNNTSEVIARLGYETQVTLVCHTTGPAVYGRNAKSSTLWDKVTTPGGNTGYVPDVWVLTEAEVPTLVEAC